MAFTVPNATDLAGDVIASLDQSEPDSLDFQLLGNRKYAVLSGADATVTSAASNSPTPGYVNVALTQGEFLINGTFITAPAATAVVPIASTDPRFDVVCAYNNAGSCTYVVVGGTSSATNPIFPTIPATHIPLYAVYVRSGYNSTALNKVTIDKRVIDRSSPVRTGSGAPAGSLGNVGDLYVRSDLSAVGRQSQLYVKVEATTWEHIAEFAELTGDVTTSGAVSTIASGAVTSEKLGPTEVTSVRTGTPITLGLTDANKMIRVSSGRVDLPTTSTLAYPVGTNLHFMATTSTRITIQAGAGATVNSSIGGTIATRAAWSVATALKIDATTWVVFGDVAP